MDEVKQKQEKEDALAEVERDIQRFQLSEQTAYQPQKGTSTPSSSEQSSHIPPTGLELQRRIFSKNRRHPGGGLQWIDEAELKKQRRFVHQIKFSPIPPQTHNSILEVWLLMCCGSLAKTSSRERISPRLPSLVNLPWFLSCVSRS